MSDGSWLLQSLIPPDAAWARLPDLTARGVWELKTMAELLSRILAGR
jgi:hypothetical protein